MQFCFQEMFSYSIMKNLKFDEEGNYPNFINYQIPPENRGNF